MKPMEQYQQNGLEIPISLRPGIWFHLLIWGGGSFLIFSGVLVITKGDFLEKTIGVFGIMFFGTALGIMIFALFRSRKRGIFELSKEGMFMSHIGLVFPWNDIGPAWIATTKNQGVTTKDVVFLLRNVSEHTKQMGGMARLLMKMSKKVAHSKSEGVVDWGLKSIMFATDADDKIQTQLSRELERVRDSVINNPDVTAFNVPLPFRFGISAEDLVSIINSEVAKK